MFESTFLNGDNVGPQRCWNDKGELIDCSSYGITSDMKMISPEEQKANQQQEQEKKKEEKREY